MRYYKAILRIPYPSFVVGVMRYYKIIPSVHCYPLCYIYFALLQATLRVLYPSLFVAVIHCYKAMLMFCWNAILVTQYPILCCGYAALLQIKPQLRCTILRGAGAVIRYYKAMLGVHQYASCYTETEMSSFWWNFHHWLHWKLSKWQLPVQPVIKISSKWRHFRFSVSVIQSQSNKGISSIHYPLLYCGCDTLLQSNTAILWMHNPKMCFGCDVLLQSHINGALSSLVLWLCYKTTMLRMHNPPLCYGYDALLKSHTKSALSSIVMWLWCVVTKPYKGCTILHYVVYGVFSQSCNQDAA